MTTKITDKNISNLANIGVQWQSVFTGDGSTGLTTVAGRGYFIDTTSGTVTVTLPASPSVGDVVVLKDYARTWNTNNVTTSTALFDGTSITNTFSTNGLTITLVYMDDTRGWSLVNEDTTSSLGAVHISATGGTVTTSGDYKIHTFTGDGCFVVSSVGNTGVPTTYRDKVDYIVVGGGGSGGNEEGGGGGAGGFRESGGTSGGCYTVSPLAAPSFTITAQTYPITVGAGGAGQANPGPGSTGNSGSASSFSTISSAGGGFGGAHNGCSGGSGGSGGGGGGNGPSTNYGAGNTPPVSPPQGNRGGAGDSPGDGGGGGGATAVGATTPGSAGGAGGAGAGNNINPATGETSGCTQYYAGGGGGASPATVGAGGLGGGGRGSNESPSPAVKVENGDANTGGGGGGNRSHGAPSAYGNPGSGAGGKGIVIIRYKYQ